MRISRALLGLLAAGCTSAPNVDEAQEYFGTLEPFASESVYFIVTDRFVDGDPGNNHEQQGGENGTFDSPVRLDGELPGNIGYLGGDFQGVIDNAGYIADMGFTALWLTPIVDNPDEAFTGGIRPGEGFGADRGKSGYHGYWGVNFFVVDEHLESPGLSFADLTRRLRDEHELKFVLDVVTNHGSPAYTMPIDQPKYGELYDSEGRLVADHQNLHPAELDADNPLHAMFSREPDLAQLADFDAGNPDVLEYFVAAYSQWLDQGVAAFRIDTVKHMPHAFWHKFSERIRRHRPGLFMFAEHWSFDTEALAEHTRPENGAISVLDFPGKAAMEDVFAKGAGFERLADYLQLDSGTFENPYELMTFYDNHDMPRIDMPDDAFIDAHNWLFTSRGIPVVYYGSEMGFRRGTPEHGGNRDYFGADNVRLASQHPIRRAMARVAKLRRDTIALQRGLQVNLRLDGDTAAFLRVYQRGGEAQTVLVMLNKGDTTREIRLSSMLDHGRWQDVLNGQSLTIGADGISAEVAAHGLRVFVRDGNVENATLGSELDRLMRRQVATTP